MPVHAMQVKCSISLICCVSLFLISVTILVFCLYFSLYNFLFFLFMPDSPTLALRRQIITNGPVSVSDDFIMIGDISYPLSTKTTYTNIRDQPYTLASVFHLYDTRSMDHGDYISDCREKHVEPISFLDRERILDDLLSPLPLDKIAITKPSRMHPIDISRIISKYTELKRAHPAGIQCILLPRDDLTIKSSIFAGIDANGYVAHGDRMFKIVHSPSEVESVEQIAAVFIDGSAWQFNEWPRSLTDRMKYIPVFHLMVDGGSTPPVLSFPATILRTEDLSDSYPNERTSTAFWSIMGAHSVSS